MPTTPFLTDIDSRAAVKGSRDPLGIQQIWTGLGRHVVGNLTTVSNSVRDFTTLGRRIRPREVRCSAGDEGDEGGVAGLETDVMRATIRIIADDAC